MLARSGPFLCALFVTSGLLLLQTFIGGRVLLFLFPGLALIGIGTLIGVAMFVRSKARPDLYCLCATGVFCAYLLLRALASPAYFARPDLFSIIGAVLVYTLTATIITSSSIRAAIITALLGFGLVHVLIGFLQFNRGDNFMLLSFLQRADYGQRASGFYVCPNHLAGLLEVLGIFGISFVCWSRWPMWSKLLLAYATAVCYVGLALTGSRGGYLSTIASVLVFGALSLVILRAAHRRSWWKYGAIGLAAIALLLTTGSVVIRQSGFLSQRAGNIADTKNMRVELWRAALKQWRLEPVLGTGSGTYRFYGRQFREKDMQNDPIDVHNDYLHLLCEYGLIGAAGFLIFFAAHLRQGFRSVRHSVRAVASGGHAVQSNRLAITLGALAAIAAYVVHSIFDFNLHIPANAALLAFVFGLVANSGNGHRSKVSEVTTFFIPRLTMAALGTILLIQCVRLFPGEYYGERARVALRDEDPATSIFFAKKALEFERRNPELLFYLGRSIIALANQSDQPTDRINSYQPAAAAFEEAQRLAPLDVTYPLTLAFTYDEMGRFADAESMYSVARSCDPSSLAVAQLYRAHLQSWKRISAGENSPL
ncbi:MAG: O-antigen ligase family protein [Chthoniobacterales bacterium]